LVFILLMRNRQAEVPKTDAAFCDMAQRMRDWNAIRNDAVNFALFLVNIERN